jgi:hypothetical protein
MARNAISSEGFVGCAATPPPAARGTPVLFCRRTLRPGFRLFSGLERWASARDRQARAPRLSAHASLPGHRVFLLSPPSRHSMRISFFRRVTAGAPAVDNIGGKWRKPLLHFLNGLEPDIGFRRLRRRETILADAWLLASRFSANVGLRMRRKGPPKCPTTSL